MSPTNAARWRHEAVSPPEIMVGSKRPDTAHELKRDCRTPQSRVEVWQARQMPRSIACGGLRARPAPETIGPAARARLEASPQPLTSVLLQAGTRTEPARPVPTTLPDMLNIWIAMLQQVFNQIAYHVGGTLPGMPFQVGTILFSALSNASPNCVRRPLPAACA